MPIIKNTQVFDHRWEYDRQAKAHIYVKNGLNAAVTAGTDTVISDLNGAQKYADVTGIGATTTAVSTSIEDNPAGTGAGYLIIQGVLAAPYYQICQEIIPLDGQSGITLKYDYFWINQARVDVANAGDIVVTIGGNDVSKIPAGRLSARSTVFYMPGYDFGGNKYKPGRPHLWHGDVIKKQAASCRLTLEGIEPLGSIWYELDTRGLSASGTSSAEWDYHISITAGAGGRVTANTDTNNLEISAGFNIFLGVH